MTQILIALVSGIIVAVPALGALRYQSQRHKAMTPKEEDEFVSRTAKQGVEMMDQILEAARRERAELLERVATLESRVNELTTKNFELEAELARLRPAAV